MTPETAEKALVKDWLDLHGFFHFPLTAGMGSYRGAPDRIAIKWGKAVAIEVKAKTGHQTEHERNFQTAWVMAGGQYVIGTGDQIISELKKLYDHQA